MKIAIIAPMLPPRWSWWQVIDKLAESHDITVYVPEPNCFASWGYEQIRDSRDEKRPFRVEKVKAPISNFLSRNRYAQYAVRSAFDLIMDGTGYYTYRRASQSKPDLIFCPDTPYLASFIATFTAKRGNVPLVMRQAYDKFNKIPLPSYSLYRYVISHVDKFILDTTLREKSLLIHGIPISNINMIPGPIDLGRFKVGKSDFLSDRLGLQNGPIILFVGRLSIIKGLPYLLKAFSRVLPTIPNANLVLVGEGPEKDALQDEAGELGIKDSVFFAGKVDWGEIHRVYQSADVLVLPSIYEQGGGLLLEAMACGVSIVASEVGGIPEVCGGKAVLVEPMNPEAISQAVVKILLDRDFAKKLSMAGRQEVEERHDLEMVTKQWEEVFISAALRE